MSDLISRQAAIDAIMGEPTDAHYPSWYAERLEQLPSAQQERIIYGNMSDEEFEKWLYGHGICSPNIREPIPCAVVPLLIDNAISELPSAQPERKKGRWIPVDSYSAFGGDEATWIAHGNPVAFYYCSECKEQAYAGEDGEPLLTAYCPNCGADMRGEQDE